MVKRNRKARRFFALSAAAATALAGLFNPRFSAAHDVSNYYGPGGSITAPTTGDWNTASNWDTSPTVLAPDPDAELDFGGSGSTGYVSTDDLSGTFNLNEIQLNSTATAAETIGASAGVSLNFVPDSDSIAPSIVQNGSGAFIINPNISLTDTLTISGTGTGTVTLNGAMSESGGSYALNLTGAGAVALGGANTYSGGTTINAGSTLDFNNAAAIGTGALTINGGALDNTSGAAIINSKNNAQSWAGDFTFNGSNALNLGTGAVTLSASRTLTVNGTGALTVGGVISDGGNAYGLTVQGTGTLILTNASNTFTGNIVVNGAVLAAANTNTALTPLGGQIGTTFRTLTLQNGGTFDSTATSFNDNTPSTANAGLVFIIGTGGGAIEVDSGRTVIIDDGNTGVTGTGSTAQELQGSGAFVKTGAGILTLRDQYQFAGTIEIAAGTLLPTGASGVFGTSAAGSSIDSGATLDLNGQAITDTDVLTISGTGLAAAPKGVITNSSTTAGSYAGAILLGADSSIGPSTSGGITLSGGISGAHNLTAAGAGTGTITLSGVIAASVLSVTENGTAPLVLSNGTNAFGSLSILAGTVEGSQNTSGQTTSLGSGTVTLGASSGSASATLQFQGTFATFANPIVLGSTTGTLTIQSLNGTTAETFTGGITGPNNVTFNAGTDTIALTVSAGSVNNAGGIFSIGTGSGGVLITSTLGPLVTSVEQMGASPFTISSALPLATINAVPGVGTVFTSVGSGTFTLSNTFTGAMTNNALIFDANSTGSIVAASAAGVMNPTGAILNSGTGTGTAIIGNGAAFGALGTAITGITENSATSALQIDPTVASTYTGPISILSGQINVGGIGSALGTGAVTNRVTIGAASGSANATLSAISTFTYNQPITIASGSSGILSISGSANAGTFSGVVTMNNNLTLGTTGSASGVTISGGLTGTGKLTINAATTSGGVTISGAAINMIGSITNISAVGNTSLISAAIGANVTGLTQNGAGNLQISGTQTYSFPAVVASGVLEYVNTASLPFYNSGPASSVNVAVANGGVLAFAYGGVGQFQASDIATLTTGTYGNVTFASGSGLGIDTSAISESYTNTIADPAGAPGFGFVKIGANTLTLGSANTYTGPTTVQNGTLTVASINSVVGGATSSSLGAPSSAANGVINLGFGTSTGTLSYAGPGETTDRVINLSGTTGGGDLDQSGSGTLTFTGNMTFTGIGAKTLTFSGSTGSVGTFTGVIAGGIYQAAQGQLTIAKVGTGTWNATGSGNTATEVTISGGAINFGSPATPLLINDLGGGFIQASGNGAVSGVIQLGGTSAGTNNGPDIGATSGVTLDLTGVSLINDATASQAYVDFYGDSATGTVLLSNTNTYTAISDISAGTYVVGSINSVTTNGATGAVHSLASSLGTPTTVANGTLDFTTTLGAGLKYIGAGETTDRNMVFTSTTGGIATTLDQSGTGLLKFLGTITASGAATHILNLQGSTAGTGEMAGAIGQNSTTNTTSITKNGAGQWTLSGANTYTGTTTVNGGNLILTAASGGTLSDTHITISSGGMLSIARGAYTAGNTATAAAGATLTVNSGGTLNLADGTLGNFNIVQNSTFAGSAATFAGGNLVFDLGSAATQSNIDEIVVSLNNVAGTGLATSSGTNGITINPLAADSSLAAGTYTLIDAAGTLSNSNFYLATPNLRVGGTLYNLSLSLVGTNEVLTVASGGPAGTPGVAFWEGTTNSSWAYQPGGAGTATNWAVSPNGTPDTYALPGAGTNVTFTANAVGPGGLSTTLDQNFEINSLTFSGGVTADSAGVTIASGSGTNTLKIDAAAVNGDTAGNGITANVGAGNNTISANVILGANQTWTNNSTTGALIVSGVVSGGFGLTIAGAGVTALNGANIYTGVTTINAGATLSFNNVANGGSPSGLGGDSSSTATNIVFAGNSTLEFTGATATTDRAFTINAGVTATIDAAAGASLTLPGATGAVTTGALTKTDLGTLILGGANTYTGNTNVVGGVLNLTGSLTGNGTTTGGSTLFVANTGGVGVVNIAGNVSTYYGYSGANVPGAVSVYNQTAGTFSSTTNTTTEQTNYVAGNGGYGYFNMTGGTFNSNERFTIATSATATNPGTIGVMYVGGTAIFNSNTEYMLIAYNDNSDIGELTVGPGGTVNHNSSGDPLAIYWTNPGETGILNVAGGLLSTTAGHGIQFGSGGNSGGNIGFANFDGGVYQTNASISASNNTSAIEAYDYMNAAGGTIKTTAGLTTIFPGNNTNVTVLTTLFGPINNAAATGDSSQNFTGGLTIDTGTFTSTLTQVLNGAAASGVYAANLTVTGGTGYVGAPAVTFTGGTLAANGSPASGYALISNGAVTGIVITDPGEYTAAPTLTLSGGGGTGASVAIDALTANPNTGGLTKLSAGTLTIAAANTFGGAVDIKGGLLTTTLLANGGQPSGIGQSSNAAANVLLDGGVLGYSGTTPGTTDRNFTLNASGGGFDASGTVAAATFTLTSSNNIVVTPTLGSISMILQGSGTATTGYGSIGSLIANASGTTVGLTKQGTGEWIITNPSNTYSGPTLINGGTLSISTLANGGSPSSIGASSNAAANLVLSGSTLLYTGVGSTTNRNYTFGNATTASAATIDNEGTGPLVIGGSMTAINAAANTQILTLIADAASGNNSMGGVNDSNTGSGALTGVTKTGAGAWAITGSSNYSGATNLSAGTLTFSGIGEMSGATQISIANGTVLQVFDDAATINHTANNITVSNGGTVTINVGNNGGATTASTVAFGALNNGVPANNFSTNFDFNGANGYLLTFASLGLPGNTGDNTVLIPTNTSVVITGNVTNQMTVAATHFDTVFLDGTSTGNAIDGAISDSSIYTSVSNGDTRVTKQNTSTWTLAGASSYHGPTAINAGTLILSGSIGNPSITPAFAGSTAVTVASGATFTETSTGAILNGSSLTTSGATILAGANTYTGATTVSAATLTLTGSLGNTAISVANGATFAPLAGSGSVSAGNTLTAAAGATLNIAANGSLNMVDGAIGTFDLIQGGTDAAAALTLATANLDLELASSGADQIIVTGGATNSAITGTNTVSLTTLGTSLTAGVYPIVTAPGIAAANTLFKFGNGAQSESILLNGVTYQISLTSTPGVEDLTVGSGAVLTSLTWTGQTNGNGAANSVWIASPSGNFNFTDSTPTPQDYTEGSNVVFQDLNPITAVNVTNGTVTIDAAGVNPGSVTVNNTAVNYTFQNASGNFGIAGATGLTKTGTGTLTLLGANTYTGVTAINGGVVALGVNDAAGNGPLGNGGPIVFNGGTLQYSAANKFDYSSRFSAAADNLISIDSNGQNITFATGLTSSGGTLTKLGSGILTLSAVNTFSGALTIVAGEVSVTSANAAAGALGSLAGITVQSGGILDLTNSDTLGYTGGRNVLMILGGTVQNNTAGNLRDTVFNTITMVGGFLAGTSTGAASNTGAFSLDASTSISATSDASGNPATVSADISTQVSSTFNVTRGAFVAAGAPDLLVSGVISPYGTGTASITIAGNGITTFTNANTFKGGVILLGGTLNSNNATGLGPAATSPLVFGNNPATAGVAVATLNLGAGVSETVSSLNVQTNTAAYNPANPATYNTLSIPAGQTFTVAGAVSLANITGAPDIIANLSLGADSGAFAVNLGTASAMAIAQHGTTTPTGSGTFATLDLSNASSVSIMGSGTASLSLGISSVNSGNSADITQGTLLLSAAGTNTVNVPTITLGSSSNTGTAGIIGILQLGGAANNFSVDTLYVGRQKSQQNGSTIDLVTIDPGGTWTLGGLTSGTTNLNIGYNDVSATATISTAKVDLTGGTFIGTLGTLTIGYYNTGAAAGGGIGTLIMPAGSVTANAIVLADQNGGTVHADSAGTLTLSGGSITLNAGGSGITSGVGTAGIATVNLSGTGDLELANQPVTLNGASSAFNFTGGTFANVSIYSVAGSTNLTDAGGLVNRNVTGTSTLGTLAFTSAASALSVTAGTFSTTAITTTNSAATVTVDGGTLELNGGAIGGATAVNNLNLESGALQDVSQINNGAAITKTASVSNPTSNTLILAGTNGFTGALTVASGVVNVQSNAGLGAAASVTVNNGTTLALSNNIAVGAEPLMLNGGGYAATNQLGALVNLSGTNTFGGAIALATSSTIAAAPGSTLNLTGNVTKTGTVATFSGGGAVNVSGQITGTDAGFDSDLAVNAGTTVTLTNANNNYFGPTTVSGGATLVSGVANALPTSTVLTLGAADNSVGTFDLGGFNQTVAGLASAGTGSPQTVTNSGASGTNALTFNNTLNSTVNLATNNFSYSGAINDGANAMTAVVQNGNNTIAFSGASDYSGGTTLNGGVLLANTLASAGSATGFGSVTIASGGALAGGGVGLAGGNVATGPSVNAVTVNSGGVISAGHGTSATSSTGLLTTTGGATAGYSQVWNAGGTYAWKLNTTTPTAAALVAATASLPGTTDPGGAGANWDMLSMQTLNVSASGATPFIINLVDAGNDAGFNKTSSYNWTIADVTSANGISLNGTSTGGNYTSFLAALSLNVPPALASAASSVNGSFALGVTSDGGAGEDLIVSYSATPEPTSLLLLGLGAGGLLTRRRRARGQSDSQPKSA